MHRVFVASAAGLGLALASIGGGQAATVFSQAGMSIDGGDVSDLELGAPKFVYDDFFLQEKTLINHATWRGFYSLGNGSVTSDNFSLLFFHDTGLPGADGLGDSIGSFNLGRVSRRSISDGSIDGLFEYSDNLGDGLELDPGTYWISIVNQTLFDTDSWFWGSGGPGNGYLLGSSLGESSGSRASKDNYFLLASNPEVIPLPASWLLLCTGLGLIASFAWRGPVPR